MRFKTPLLVSLVILILLTFLPNIRAESGPADIFYIQAPNNELYQRTRVTLLSAKPELEQLLGTQLTDSIRVFIAAERYDFDTLTFGGIPDWGVGVAVPRRNLIAVMSPVKENFALPFEEVLRHELAHLAIHRRVEGNKIPRFMNEGFAMMFAHQWTFSDDIYLTRANLTGSLFHLREIDYVNMVNTTQAQIAYAQSYQAVKFIFDTFGQETFQRILDGLAMGQSADVTLRQVIGTDMDGLDKMVAKYINRNYHWIMLLTDPNILWIGLALLFILGYLLIRKRRKDIYKKWEEEEKYESTDFDYEDSSRWD